MHFFDCKADGVSDETSDDGVGQRRESSGEWGRRQLKRFNDEGVLGGVVRP